MMKNKKTKRSGKKLKKLKTEINLKKQTQKNVEINL